jgi:hypothetical protein
MYLIEVDGSADGKLVCLVEGDSMAISSWQYGTVPTDYRREGQCRPLGPGQYRVSVAGQGRGAATFEVHGDGRIRLLSGMC